jgi:hypothetical protein
VTKHGVGRRAHKGGAVSGPAFRPARIGRRCSAGLFVLRLPRAGAGTRDRERRVDATAAGQPLERVWPFHGYDEINYTTVPEGKALLGTIAAAHTAPVHVRNHFLLNTGDGTPALKWGSTNVYTEDGDSNPVYNWTLTDGIMDTIIRRGCVSLRGDRLHAPGVSSRGERPAARPGRAALLAVVAPAPGARRLAGRCPFRAASSHG